MHDPHKCMLTAKNISGAPNELVKELLSVLLAFGEIFDTDMECLLL